MINVILRMDKFYGLNIVAERVETEEQHTYLKNAKWLFSNGYLLTKLKKFDEFVHFLDCR